jgi:oligopeptide transport system substrate-binding protein
MQNQPHRTDKEQIMRRNTFALLSVLVLLGLTIGGCNGAAQSTPQVVEKVVTQVVEKPVEKQVISTQIVQVEKQILVTATPLPQSDGPKTLRIPSFGPGDLPTLDPNFGEDTGSVQWINETTTGLTTLNEQTTAVEPGIAEKWDVSSDGLTYTFHLRDNIPWVKYDAGKDQVVKVPGCPDKDNKTTDRLVTAQDFEYSILRALNPKTASPYAYVLAFVIDGADQYNSGEITDTARVGVKSLDTRTLQVKFKEPAAYNLNIIGLWTAHATPRWLIEGDDCTEARADRWIETGFFQSYGPFTLKSWMHDSDATFVKNPFWPGTDEIPQPKLDEIRIRFLGAPQALGEYEAGNLDWSTVPLADIDRIKTDPVLSAQLRVAPRLSTYFYGFNTKAPFVDDVRVRRALSLAIDRQSLIDNVLKSGQEPAQWFCRPGLTACPTVKDYPDLGVKYDPAQARQLLDEYLKAKGITAGKLDLTLMYDTNEDHKRIAEAIQNMWKTNLGIDVKLVSQEFKVFLDTTSDPQNTPQIFRDGWNLDYPDANNFDREAVAFGGSRNPKEGGALDWKNDRYEELVKQAAVEMDLKKRTDLYAQAEKILVWDDAVLAPIYWYTRVQLTKPNVARTYANTGDERYEKWDVDMTQVQ